MLGHIHRVTGLEISEIEKDDFGGEYTKRITIHTEDGSLEYVLFADDAENLEDK